MDHKNRMQGVRTRLANTNGTQDDNEGSPTSLSHPFSGAGAAWCCSCRGSGGRDPDLARRAGREREQRTIARIMTTQGETLIRAVEAARRMGMRGQEGRSSACAFLMDEMIRQGDLRFWVWSTPRAGFEALSEAEPGSGVTAEALAALPASTEPAWKIIRLGHDPLFVVYRYSRPRPPGAP
jgi:hypothetical protein